MVFGHFVLVANIIYIYSNNKYIPTYINYHFISENRNILHFSSNISNYYNFKYAFSFLVEYFFSLILKNQCYFEDKRILPLFYKNWLYISSFNIAPKIEKLLFHKFN